MKLFRYAAALVMAAFVISGLLATHAYAQQRNVSGVLEKSTEDAPGSPGWQIKLDEPIFLGGIANYTVEVYLDGEDLSPHEGKRVRAAGTFVQWKTPERGKFIVLEICEIIPAGE